MTENIEQNTPEESEQFEAERRASLGTAKEWAELQDDLSILVDLRQTLENGVKGRSEQVVTPNDPNYIELMRTHKLVKPGDSSFVYKKFVDDQWMLKDVTTQTKQD